MIPDELIKEVRKDSIHRRRISNESSEAIVSPIENMEPGDAKDAMKAMAKVIIGTDKYQEHKENI